MVQNADLEEKLFNYIKGSVDSTPFYNLLGIKLLKLGRGIAELSVTPEDQHSNPIGLIHGGLVMSLADAAMGNAIRSTGIKAVTVDCSTGFLSAAEVGETVVAKGKVLKVGRKIIFAEAKVWAGEKLLADARGTFYKTGEINID